jgi:hypothetical protein
VYKALDDTHFEPFVVESEGELGVKAQEIFKKICNLITQSTGQSGSSIAYFWKSRLLVILAKLGSGCGDSPHAVRPRFRLFCCGAKSLRPADI